MTSIYQKLALAIAGTALNLAAITVHSARAATFSFFLTETPSEFLPVSGMFEGTDLDFNGLITKDEVSRYEAIFGRNYKTSLTLPTFVHTLDNLVAFSFDVSDFTQFNFRSSLTVEGNTSVLLQSTSDEENELTSGRGVAVVILENMSLGTSELFTVVEAKAVPEPRDVWGLSVFGVSLFLMKKLASSRQS
jgi:hypothetical protein